MHLDMCLIIGMCAGRFELGFTHDAFLIFHVTCSCIFHAYVFSFLFYSCFLVVMFSFSLFFSLSRINCAWHPKRINPFRAKILFKVPALLLLIPFPLLTFNSMMRIPERTSWRTFKNVAFIRSVILFC